MFIHTHACSLVHVCILHVHTHTHTHRLLNGAEYLFIAKDEIDVLSWVASIKSAIQQGPPTTTTPNPLTLSLGAGEEEDKEYPIYSHGIASSLAGLG